MKHRHEQPACMSSGAAYLPRGSSGPGIRAQREGGRGCCCRCSLSSWGQMGGWKLGCFPALCSRFFAPKPNRHAADGMRLERTAGNVILNGNGCPIPPPFPLSQSLLLSLSLLLSPSATPHQPSSPGPLSHTHYLSFLVNRLFSRLRYLTHDY